MIDHERGRVTKRPPNPYSKRHHHRAASHIARGEQITTDDYAKPLLLPRRILWCEKGGVAERWLRCARLPWWFFGSFVNLCYVHRTGKGTLTECLRSYPMDEQVLIEVMEDYFDAWTKEEQPIHHTVLVDIYELEHHRHPAALLKEAQDDLLDQIRYLHADRSPSLLRHKSRFQPHTLTAGEKEFLRLYPTGKISYSLPIRSGGSHAVTTTAHAQCQPTVEHTQQRQDEKSLDSRHAVVAASVEQSPALIPAKSRTFTVSLRPGTQRSNKAALEPIDQYHGFLVLRSQTRINRANFFGPYQGQRANL